MTLSLRIACLALFLGLSSVVGCGSDNSVSEIQESDQAKAADENMQKAMQEFMQTKTKSKKGGGTTSPIAPR